MAPDGRLFFRIVFSPEGSFPPEDFSCPADTLVGDFISQIASQHGINRRESKITVLFGGRPLLPDSTMPATLSPTHPLIVAVFRRHSEPAPAAASSSNSTALPSTAAARVGETGTPDSRTRPGIEQLLDAGVTPTEVFAMRRNLASALGISEAELHAGSAPGAPDPDLLARTVGPDAIALRMLAETRHPRVLALEDSFVSDQAVNAGPTDATSRLLSFRLNAAGGLARGPQLADPRFPVVLSEAYELCPDDSRDSLHRMSSDPGTLLAHSVLGLLAGFLLHIVLLPLMLQPRMSPALRLGLVGGAMLNLFFSAVVALTNWIVSLF